MRNVAGVLAAVIASAVPSAAQASEVFAGLYAHDVKLPTNLSGLETGIDVQVGFRGGTLARPLGAALQPYVFGALNTSGETSYAAAGLSLRFDLGNRVYIRPGVGIAIHNGSDDDFYRTDKIAFGSRVLFEPEIGIGTQLTDKVSLEASWVHMSHAQLRGRENPGIDNLGFRLNIGL